MYPSKKSASRHYAECWEGQYQRNVTKRSSKQNDNFRLDGTGDLVMIGPLTSHARKRCHERGISHNKAMKTSGVRTSNTINAVVATVIDPGRRRHNNNNNRPAKELPTQHELPSGHVIETLDVPKQSVGHVIGSKGRNINHLRAMHQVDIVLSDHKDTSKTTISVYGPADGVNKTLESIQATVNKVIADEQKRASIMCKCLVEER